MRNSITMANDDLGSPFQLIFEDNSLDSARTVTGVRGLINNAAVRALIVYASGPSNAAAPIAEQARIPMIGLSVDPNVSKTRKWVMIHWASNEHVADQLIAELKARRLSRIAVLTTQVQGILDLEQVFFERAKTAGLEIVFHDQVLPTETDFGVLVSKTRASKPHAVFLNFYYGQSGVFALKCAAQKFYPQFFGQFALDDDAEIASSQGALDGAFFANTAPGDLSFDQAYIKRFGKRPSLGGIGAYDATAIFAAAFKDGLGTAESVNHYIHSLNDFSGKIGSYGALNNNSYAVPARIGDIVDGQVRKRSN